MAEGINKVILVGNVGKDPEVRNGKNDSKFANFTLATSESWKLNGEKKEKTEWHKIAVGGILVNYVEKFVKKGAKLYVEGKIETNKWTDRDGNPKSTIQIRALKILGLGSLRDVSENSSNSKYGDNNYSNDSNYNNDDETPF